MFKKRIQDVDPEISQAIADEIIRLEETLQLIPSENVLDDVIMQVQGSVLTTKYAEGYPGKRYYGGCEHVDVVENLAIDRAKKIFKCDFANVQPHSGSSANFAIMSALLKPGDRIMGMSLDCGGHLTHGHALNFSGKLYETVPYTVDRTTETIDYDAVRALAKKHQPHMIICGATAYPRIIDFEAFGAIAKEVGALVLADISHIAGLILAGEHPSSIPHVDVTMTTTHKTLGGPRGGIILTNNPELASTINRSIIPGCQGGPLMNEIAGKAVAFKLATEARFIQEQGQIVRNAKALAASLQGHGIRLVSGGTDNHLLLADVSLLGMESREAEARLAAIGITVNKNAIPFDTKKPLNPSGIRLGSVIPTRRGMGEAEMAVIGDAIGAVWLSEQDESATRALKEKVRTLCLGFPFYRHLHTLYT